MVDPPIPPPQFKKVKNLDQILNAINSIAEEFGKKIIVSTHPRTSKKIKDEALFSYNVYQIEGEGRSLFLKIEGSEDTIMGLPIKQIKEYLNSL